MIPIIFSFCSLAFLLICLSYLIAFLVSPRKLKVPLVLFLAIGVFFAAFLLFVPTNIVKFSGSNLSVLKTVFVSVYNTIALFTANSDYAAIYEYTTSIENPVVLNFYRVLGSIVYVTAPGLTFGIVLSFFRNARAKIVYALSFNRKIYVFSELNLKTILLAEDIRSKEKRVAIAFTGVGNDFKNENEELFERADVIKSIMFKEPLSSLSFKHHAKGKKITIFVFNENDDESIVLFDSAYNALKNNPNASIYFRSNSSQGKLVFNHNDEHQVKTFRINYDILFIYHYLKEQGTKLFDNAKYDEKLKRKVISVLIFGLGRYGKQLLKALCWYCQMDGYYLKITGIDKDPNILSKLSSEAPELFDEHNKKDVFGDAQYDITIYQGVANHTLEFDNILKGLKDITVAFACTGEDERNVDAAMNMRMNFERIDTHPIIYATVSGDRAELFNNATNFRGVAYNIDYLGDYKTSYSIDTIMNTGLEAKALELHCRYKKEEEFWKYEYNYRSSLATAIHLEAKLHCKIPGAGEELESLDESVRNKLEALEHRRWNAFMRGEGYIHTPDQDKVKTSLGKMHYDLVSYDELSEEDKRKDSLVTTKRAGK